MPIKAIARQRGLGRNTVRREPGTSSAPRRTTSLPSLLSHELQAPHARGTGAGCKERREVRHHEVLAARGRAESGRELSCDHGEAVARFRGRPAAGPPRPRACGGASRGASSTALRIPRTRRAPRSCGNSSTPGPRLAVEARAAPAAHRVRRVRPARGPGRASAPVAKATGSWLVRISLLGHLGGLRGCAGVTTGRRGGRWRARRRPPSPRPRRSDRIALRRRGGTAS